MLVFKVGKQDLRPSAETRQEPRRLRRARLGAGGTMLIYRALD
jgi:hypothetical protein